MSHDPAHDDLPAALRMQLRSLRVDAPPARDLWPDIATRLAGPREAALPPAPRRPRLMPAFAIAATLALALGAAWQLRPDGASPATPAAPAGATGATAPFLAEAHALTREYEGALRELAPLAPAAGDSEALRQLDASAADVRQALAQDPDARFLLQRLQRVYAQRLSLTQRLARA